MMSPETFDRSKVPLRPRRMVRENASVSSGPRLASARARRSSAARSTLLLRGRAALVACQFREVPRVGTDLLRNLFHHLVKPRGLLGSSRTRARDHRCQDEQSLLESWELEVWEWSLIQPRDDAGGAFLVAFAHLVDERDGVLQQRDLASQGFEQTVPAPRSLDGSACIAARLSPIAASITVRLACSTSAVSGSSSEPSALAMTSRPAMART